MKKFLYSVLLAVLAVTIALFAVGCAKTDDNGSQPEPPAKYALSYAGGEGATGTAPETKEYEANAKVKLADNPFTLADHTFAGWSDGTTVYDEGADFTMPAHAVTLTATWTKNEPEPLAKYALSYAGGEGAQGTAPETKEYEANVKVKLADNPFTLADHTFAGWSDGTTVYEEGADFTMPAHAVTLTAKWTKNEPEPPAKYALSYAGGEGATGTAPETKEYEANAKVKLADNPFTRTDYAFAGWSDGTTVYEEGADFTMPAKAVTLTAQWKELFTVTFQGGEGATGTAPAASDHVEGDVFELPACPSDLTNGDKTFMGWSDGEETYQAGDDFTMPAADVTLTAQWKGPSELAGKSFYSLTSQTLYQFGNEEQDGFYSVTKIHREGISYQTSTDTVRYSYDGKEYKVQVKGDTWTDALTLTEVGKEITLEGKVCYLCGVAQTVKTADEALTLGFTLDVAHEDAKGFTFTFTALTVNGQTTERTEFSLSNYTLSVAYDKEGTTYRVTVSLADLSYTSEVYRITLTAEVDGVNYRATFSDPTNDHFSTLEKFAVQKGSDWQELVTENKSGSSTDTGNGYHYAFTVSVTEDSTKTTYKIFSYTATEEKEAYFTVTKSEEHLKVTKTLTTPDGLYRTTWEYDDPNDAELTVFEKGFPKKDAPEEMDYEIKWKKGSPNNGSSTAVRSSNNVYTVTFSYKELIIDDMESSRYHTVEHTVVLVVTFVPAQGGGEHSVQITEPQTSDVTFGDEIEGDLTELGLTEADDGIRRYRITVTVDQSGKIIAFKAFDVYRLNWAKKEFQLLASFNPAGVSTDREGFYVFTQKVAVQGQSSQEITWHIKLKLTSEGENKFTYELHLQNEVTFEVNGEVIPELTRLVDEKGKVTLPTAEQIKEHVPEGMEFKGWKLGDDAQEGTEYTTGEYGEKAEFPTAADVKFVADLVKAEPVQNDLAGQLFFDFQGKKVYVFNGEKSDGYYTVTTYERWGQWVKNDTEFVYSVSESGYTIYSKSGMEQVATFATVGEKITFESSTAWGVGSTATFELTEGESKVSFSFKVDDIRAGESSMTHAITIAVDISTPIYNGKAAKFSSSTFSPIDCSTKVTFEEGDDLCEAEIDLVNLTSEKKVTVTYYYTLDKGYRAVLTTVSWVQTGFAYCTLAEKQEDGSYVAIGAQTYVSSTPNQWEIQVTVDGGETKTYTVKFVAQADDVPAHITVELPQEETPKQTINLATEGETFKATFEWDGKELTLIKLEEKVSSWYNALYDTGALRNHGELTGNERKSDTEHEFIVKYDGGGVYTITVTLGADGPVSMTVVKS